jgi:hypothetical protein
MHAQHCAGQHALTMLGAGVGNIQTLLVLGSERAVDQFRAGARGPVVIGQDLSLGQSLGFDVIEDRNLFARRDILTHSLADGAIADWSLIGVFLHAMASLLHCCTFPACCTIKSMLWPPCCMSVHCQLAAPACCTSLLHQEPCCTLDGACQGHGEVVRWHGAGGKISVDREANAAMYGPGMDIERVLGTPASTSPAAPASLRPLYAALNRIARGAEHDARSFGGFKKEWKPDLSSFTGGDS